MGGGGADGLEQKVMEMVRHFAIEQSTPERAA